MITLVLSPIFPNCRSENSRRAVSAPLRSSQLCLFPSAGSPIADQQTAMLASASRPACSSKPVNPARRKIEILPIEQGFGLCCLPAPSPGDIFLDFEADPFVGEHGIEFLFGYVLEEEGRSIYKRHWAFTRDDEKKAFENFVDLVMTRWESFPGLHIYHYAPYEPAALKRLMGRYATREEEIDRMLRAGLFVDLFAVVRRALRASVESYSIKQIEPFYGFERPTALADARAALTALQVGLELGDIAGHLRRCEGSGPGLQRR